MRLDSKKNIVCKKLVCIKNRKIWLVEKQFTDYSRFLNEKRIYEAIKSSPLNTLTIMKTEEPAENAEHCGILTFEYVNGLTSLDIINKGNLTNAARTIRKIMKWIKLFYTITAEKFNEQMILSDIHLRNFIVTNRNGEICGIDFEEVRPGLIEEDIAKLAIHIMTYDPAYTKKKFILVEYMLKYAGRAFLMNKDILLDELNKKALEISKRRKYNIDIHDIQTMIERNFL